MKNKMHGVYLVQFHSRISFIPEMQVDFGREGEIYGRNFLNCREIRSSSVGHSVMTH